MKFLIFFLPLLLFCEVQRVVVVGGGVGALTSALYLARAGVEPVVIEGKAPGGLLTQSHAVQNWPGEMEISGAALTERLRAQAERSGAKIVREELIGVDFSQRPFVLTTRALDGSDAVRAIKAHSCIIAMGSEPNLLGVPGESAFWGRGVSNCAVCDGALFREGVVGVVGGGDAAVLEALYLADLAKEVHVFVRKGTWKGVETGRLAQLRAKKNVRMHHWSTVEEVEGEEAVTGVIVKERGAIRSIPLEGLFLAIGSRPNTQLFKGALTLDEKGYIALFGDQKTSVEGVYAIGDVVDPIYKQAICAAGDGAKAALQAHDFVAQLQRPIVEIQSASELECALQESSVPLVVDFYAAWCAPCRRLEPVLEASAQNLVGQYRFVRVDVERCQELSRQYQIRSMPTVLVFDAQGEVVERIVGADQIVQRFDGLDR